MGRTMPLVLDDIRDFVSKNVGPQFHQKRLESIQKLKLSRILSRKNPYLYRAKNVTNAAELVEGILAAHLSSQEESIFGDFLEQVAVEVNRAALGGTKSGATGIDLEFVRDGVRYVVAVKSGPNWGNSGQIRQMKRDFEAYKKTAGTSGSRIHIEFINGCCYGKNRIQVKDGYHKICGQQFWELISGDGELYLQIIEPLAQDAKLRNEEFQRAYDAILNRLTAEFIAEYCDESGNIVWERIARLVSETPKPRRTKVKPALAPDTV